MTTRAVATDVPHALPEPTQSPTEIGQWPPGACLRSAVRHEQPLSSPSKEATLRAATDIRRSPSRRRAISIRQKHAALHVARLHPAETAQAATAPFVHLFVAQGSISPEGSDALTQGDAARIAGSEGQRISAGAHGAEALMWEMDTTLSFR